nr:S8 family serine peptidase [Saliniradius amylolyticus]
MKPLVAATLMALGASGAAIADDDRYIIQVDDSKKGVVKALAKKLGGDIKVDAQGFIAAKFSGKDLAEVKGLLNNPHIKLIEEDTRRYPMAMYSDDAGDPMMEQVTPYAVYQSQADQLNFDNTSNVKVCVIDSGLDDSNPDFDWSAVTGDNDSGTGNWFDHGGPHGTHVAGTIAAADNTYGVVGMAPGVPLHIIKVFNESGWGYSSDLAQAAQLCANAGANVINMSLGGGGANSTEENAFNDFINNGGLVLAAAGNDGNDVRSYPAGYESVMMIGANDADNNIASFSQYPSCSEGRGKKSTSNENICVEVTAGGVNTLSTYPAGLATLSNMTADGVSYDSSAMENMGTASAETYYMGIGDSTDAGANGKICLIDRGSISFHDKVQNCENSGGAGAVIINNEAGMLYGTLGDTNATTIPAVGAALEDRDALLAATSATVAIENGDYGYMSGTSMATPAVSGLAALVWSHFSECSGQDIRAALKATAEDAGAAGKDVYFGHGIVKALDAYNYLTTNGCSGGSDGGSGGDTGSFELTASGYKVKGSHSIDLGWSGATSTNVDIYRNGSLVATTSNDGTYTDNTGNKGGASYDYQVCEAASSTCSVTVTVSF